MPATMFEPATIPGFDALRIARQDAEKAYRDLEQRYRVQIPLAADGWHIDYELQSTTSDGGQRTTLSIQRRVKSIGRPASSDIPAFRDPMRRSEP